MKDINKDISLERYLPIKTATALKEIARRGRKGFEVSLKTEGETITLHGVSFPVPQGKALVTIEGHYAGAHGIDPYGLHAFYKAARSYRRKYLGRGS